MGVGGGPLAVGVCVCLIPFTAEWIQARISGVGVPSRLPGPPCQVLPVPLPRDNHNFIPGQVIFLDGTRLSSILSLFPDSTKILGREAFPLGLSIQMYVPCPPH